MSDTGKKNAAEVRCAVCLNYMHPSVLQAHIKRKHQPGHSSSALSTSVESSPTKPQLIGRKPYERWKVELRKRMHGFQYLITSILSKFNEPFTTKPLAESPISSKFRQMLGECLKKTMVNFYADTVVDRPVYKKAIHSIFKDMDAILGATSEAGGSADVIDVSDSDRSESSDSAENRNLDELEELLNAVKQRLDTGTPKRHRLSKRRAADERRSDRAKPRKRPRLTVYTDAAASGRCSAGAVGREETDVSLRDELLEATGEETLTEKASAEVAMAEEVGTDDEQQRKAVEDNSEQCQSSTDPQPSNENANTSGKLLTEDINSSSSFEALADTKLAEDINSSFEVPNSTLSDMSLASECIEPDDNQNQKDAAVGETAQKHDSDGGKHEGDDGKDENTDEDLKSMESGELSDSTVLLDEANVESRKVTLDLYYSACSSTDSNSVSSVSAICNENIEVPAPKNIFSHMYWSNHVYATFCRLCHKPCKKLVDHMVRHHPNAELYVARPTPGAVAEMLAQERSTCMIPHIISGIRGYCYFCEQILDLSSVRWQHHWLAHTGEMLYYCNGCDTHLSKLMKHNDTCSIENIRQVMTDRMSVSANMCKLCHFVQINERRMQLHLRNQHDFTLEADIADHYDRLQLINNPMDDIIQTAYKFVAENRFRCIVGKCSFASNNKHLLAEHLETVHVNDALDGRCQNCSSKSGKFHKISDYMRHTDCHGPYIYECGVCLGQHHNEHDILLHLFDKHAAFDATLTYRHNHRTAAASTFAESNEVRLKCDDCDELLGSTTAAVEHQSRCAMSAAPSMSVQRTVRRMNADLKTTAKVVEYAVSNETYFCCLCGQEYDTKARYLEHHDFEHPTQAVLFIEAPYSFNIGCRLTIPPQPNDCIVDLLYLCYTCYSTPSTGCEHFASAADVFSHWMQQHRTTGLEFLYTVQNLVQCEHCERCTTLAALREHQIDFHRNESIAPTGELPITLALDDRLLDELLAVHVRKCFRCVECDQRFDQFDLATKHHKHVHPTADRAIVACDDADRIAFILGDCCRERIPADKMMLHLEEHKFPNRCNLCGFYTVNLFSVFYHQVLIHELKSDPWQLFTDFLRCKFMGAWPVFGNGLIVRQSTLCGTRFDTTWKFDDVMKVLVAMMKKEMKWKGMPEN